jgi:hypothetical protein
MDEAGGESFALRLSGDPVRARHADAWFIPCARLAQCPGDGRRVGRAYPQAWALSASLARPCEC